jgi:hypothetical protein
MRDAQRRRDATDTKPQAVEQAVRMLEELARLLLRSPAVMTGNA